MGFAALYPSYAHAETSMVKRKSLKPVSMMAGAGSDPTSKFAS